MEDVINYVKLFTPSLYLNAMGNKELGTVSIAHRPCPLAEIEVQISSNFFVGIICLFSKMHVRIINIESKTGAIIRISLKFTIFSMFRLSFQFGHIHVRLPNFHEYFFF
jgi:hypothetical protein